jgi:hypothetical protein
MTTRNPKHIAICISVLLALGVTASPVPAQEDGLTGGQIILAQGQGKKKGQKAAPTGTTTTSPCGNGVIDGGENCDGADLGGKTCASLGYSSGALSCSATCGVITSGCTR